MKDRVGLFLSVVALTFFLTVTATGVVAGGIPALIIPTIAISFVLGLLARGAEFHDRNR